MPNPVASASVELRADGSHLASDIQQQTAMAAQNMTRNFNAASRAIVSNMGRLAGRVAGMTKVMMAPMIAVGGLGFKKYMDSTTTLLDSNKAAFVRYKVAANDALSGIGQKLSGMNIFGNTITGWMYKFANSLNSLNTDKVRMLVGLFEKLVAIWAGAKFIQGISRIGLAGSALLRGIGMMGSGVAGGITSKQLMGGQLAGGVTTGLTVLLAPAIAKKLSSDVITWASTRSTMTLSGLAAAGKGMAAGTVIGNMFRGAMLPKGSIPSTLAKITAGTAWSGASAAGVGAAEGAAAVGTMSFIGKIFSKLKIVGAGTISAGVAAFSSVLIAAAVSIRAARGKLQSGEGAFTSSLAEISDWMTGISNWWTGVNKNTGPQGGKEGLYQNQLGGTLATIGSWFTPGGAYPGSNSFLTIGSNPNPNSIQGQLKKAGVVVGGRAEVNTSLFNKEKKARQLEMDKIDLSIMSNVKAIQQYHKTLTMPDKVSEVGWAQIYDKFNDIFLSVKDSVNEIYENTKMTSEEKSREITKLVNKALRNSWQTRRDTMEDMRKADEDNLKNIVKESIQYKRDKKESMQKREDIMDELSSLDVEWANAQFDAKEQLDVIQKDLYKGFIGKTMSARDVVGTAQEMRSSIGKEQLETTKQIRDININLLDKWGEINESAKQMGREILKLEAEINKPAPSLYQ
jgi:hypothetical protein